MNPPPQSLPLVFRTTVEEILAKESSSTDWKLGTKNGNPELVIPKINPDGFEVSVVADEEEITVYTEYLAHQHYTSDGDHRHVCALAMGLVRDLLAPNMRIKVMEVGGSPYRATLEIFHNGEWQHDGTTGLFALPWFRKKTEKIYSNRRLTARDFADKPQP